MLGKPLMTWWQMQQNTCNFGVNLLIDLNFRVDAAREVA